MKQTMSNVTCHVAQRSQSNMLRPYAAPRLEKGPTLAAVTASKQISGLTG